MELIAEWNPAPMSIPAWHLETQQLDEDKTLYWLERYARECAEQDQLNTYN